MLLEVINFLGDLEVKPQRSPKGGNESTPALQPERFKHEKNGRSPKRRFGPPGPICGGPSTSSVDLPVPMCMGGLSVPRPPMCKDERGISIHPVIPKKSIHLTPRLKRWSPMRGAAGSGRRTSRANVRPGPKHKRVWSEVCRNSHEVCLGIHKKMGISISIHFDHEVGFPRCV